LKASKDFEKTLTFPNIGSGTASEAVVSKLLNSAQLHDCVKIVKQIIPSLDLEKIDRPQLISIAKFVQINGTNQRFSANIDRYLENHKPTSKDPAKKKDQKRKVQTTDSQKDKKRLLFTVTVDGSTFNFFGSDLDRLKDDHWLNDTVVEYFLRYVLVSLNI
jgi:Ulp1 family protease